MSQIHPLFLKGNDAGFMPLKVCSYTYVWCVLKVEVDYE